MKMQQRGLTLIEMVIAISLLAIMISAIVFSFDGSKSRAQVLVAAMEEYSGAMERLKTDASCYPRSIVALIDRDQAAGTANSFCNADLSKQWNGPYVKAASTTGTIGPGGTASGDTGQAPFILLGQISPELTLRIARASSNYGSGGTGPATWKWFIVADGVPSEIITQAMMACNGRDAELDGGAGGGAGSISKCVKSDSTAAYASSLGLAAADSGIGSFAMLFSETRK